MGWRDRPRVVTLIITVGAGRGERRWRLWTDWSIHRPQRGGASSGWQQDPLKWTVSNVIQQPRGLRVVSAGKRVPAWLRVKRRILVSKLQGQLRSGPQHLHSRRVEESLPEGNTPHRGRRRGTIFNRRRESLEVSIREGVRAAITREGDRKKQCRSTGISKLVLIAPDLPLVSLLTHVELRGP